MNIGAVPPERFERCILTAINMGHCYEYASVTVQVHIAVWTALAVAIDNWEVGADALKEFAPRMLAKTPQLHPLLDRYLEVLLETKYHFPPYAFSAIVTNAVQFINSMLLDKHEQEATCQHKALPYARYKRARSGVGEVYGFFLWDKENFPMESPHAEVAA